MVLRFTAHLHVTQTRISLTDRLFSTEAHPLECFFPLGMLMCRAERLCPAAGVCRVRCDIADACDAVQPCRRDAVLPCRRAHSNGASRRCAAAGLAQRHPRLCRDTEPAPGPAALGAGKHRRLRLPLRWPRWWQRSCGHGRGCQRRGGATVPGRSTSPLLFACICCCCCVVNYDGRFETI